MHRPTPPLRRRSLAALRSFAISRHLPIIALVGSVLLALAAVAGAGQVAASGGQTPVQAGAPDISTASAARPLTGSPQTTFLVIVPPLEDLDGDGAFDVFEDTIIRNGVLDPGEDRDGDGRLTPPDGCEGRLREDHDCDGVLDAINEDFNHNGRLDPGEDLDNDGRLDDGSEDWNENKILDDRPFPSFSDLVYDYWGGLDPLYPYGAIRPSTGGVTISAVTASGDACQCVSGSPLIRWLALVDDPDGDGAFDIYEDTIIRNGQLDPGEDRDDDGRLTPPNGCESPLREDRDCDGNLDWIDEDLNGNGIWEPELGEDLDSDRRYDDGTEDRNADRSLNDRPFISFTDYTTDPTGQRSPFYPYGVSRPGLAGQFNALQNSKDAVCECGRVF